METHDLYLALDLGEQVDELDVCAEEEASRRHAAQVELRVQKLELHRGTVTEGQSRPSQAWVQT